MTEDNGKLPLSHILRAAITGDVVRSLGGQTADGHAIAVTPFGLLCIMPNEEEQTGEPAHNSAADRINRAAAHVRKLP